MRRALLLAAVLLLGAAAAAEAAGGSASVDPEAFCGVQEGDGPMMTGAYAVVNVTGPTESQLMGYAGARSLPRAGALKASCRA